MELLNEFPSLILSTCIWYVYVYGRRIFELYIDWI